MGVCKKEAEEMRRILQMNKHQSVNLSILGLVRLGSVALGGIHLR